MARNDDKAMRLERALAALFEFQQQGGPREAFLAAHADLRDILEPMLAEPDDDGADLLGADPLAGSAPGERVVGGFRIVREVGRGGVGVVYEAWHQTLERRAALKLLLPHLMATATSVGRFLREGRTLARLDHPGIVRVLDLGCERGTHWLAMEFVEGVPFDRWLEQPRARGGHDPASLRTAVDIMAQVAAALQHAHDHGVIHRDIKPSNILVRDDATAVVTDFGLARGAELLTVTRTGVAAGTPFYMAPEQIRGGHLDARVDVFALGVTLFEALTLTRPFTGGTTEAVLQAILHNEPPDPRRLNPRLSPELAAIVAMALEKDPARRYQDAGAMARDLRAHLDFRPIKARPVSALVRIRRWVTREPLRAVLALVLVVGALSVAVLAGYVVALRPEAEAGREVLREQEFEGLLAEGFHHHVAPAPDRACSAFDRAMALRPGRADAVAGAALARQRRDGPAAALEFLDRASVGVDHADVAARVRAMILRRLDRAPDADALEGSLGAPVQPMALLLAAISALETRGDGAEALRLASLAVRVSPRPRAAIWLQWCAYAVHVKDERAAAEAALAVTRLWPGLWLSWHHAAVAWQNSDPPRALAAQRKAMDLGEDDEFGYYNLSRDEFKVGDVDGAIATLRKGVARFPKDVRLRLRLLQFLVEQERLEEALAAFDDLEQLDPRNADALEQRGQILYVQRRDEEALASFRKALEIAPESWQLWHSLAVALRKTGALEPACDALRRSITLDGKQEVSHQRLLQIQGELGDAAGQLTELERWATAHPEDADAWLALSRAQLEASVDLELVLPSALRATWLAHGRSRPALENLARVHVAAGATRAALRAWEEARALATGQDLESRRARARIEQEIRRLAPESMPATQPNGR